MPEPTTPSAGRPSLPKIEDVIGAGVEDDGDQPRGQRRPDAIERGERAARGEIEHGGGQRPLQRVQVASGVGGEVRRLADRAQNGLGVPQREPGRRGEQEGARQRLMERGAQAGEVLAVGADQAGGERGERADDADAEQQQRRVHRLAESAGGERVGRQPAEHHHVSRGHQIDRDVGEHDRPAQRQRRADFARQPAARRGRGLSGDCHRFGGADRFGLGRVQPRTIRAAAAMARPRFACWSAS